MAIIKGNNFIGEICDKLDIPTKGITEVVISAKVNDVTRMTFIKLISVEETEEIIKIIN